MLDVIDTLRASLAPRYDVEREIGAGGMARVFLAVEQHPHRRVAIKVLDPEVSTRLLRERFIREVDLSSNLSHPHIVPIFAAGETDGLFYYVMPYVEGESLRHRLLRERKLPLDDALHIARDVADALALPMHRGSSTATSSPRTSSSRATTRSSPISGSRAPSAPPAA